MDDQTRRWLDGLRGLAAAAAAVMTPTRTPAADAERRIIAAHVAALFAGHDGLLAARRAWCSGPGRAAAADADPAIVLTTSPVGIEAAAEWLAGGGPAAARTRGRLVVVTERDYRLWCIRHPDPDRLTHIAVWSWVKTRVPPQRWHEFAAHPLGEGERYWLHRTGIAGAGAADHRSCGLWKFTGRDAVPLAESLVERVASALGGSRSGRDDAVEDSGPSGPLPTGRPELPRV